MVVKQKVEKKVLAKGWYRHFKGGMYEVLDTVIDSETLQTMVLYRPEGSTDLWVRPYAMFIATVVKDGITMPRFSASDRG